jgi:hypothetical protein
MHMPEFAITTYKRRESDLVTRGPNCGAGSEWLGVVFQEVVHSARTEEAEVAKIQSTEDRMDTDKNAPRLGATPVCDGP